MLGLWAALRKLVILVGGLKVLAQLIQQLVALLHAHRSEPWFEESAALFAKLRVAQTDQERKEIAQKLIEFAMKKRGSNENASVP